MSQLFVKEEYTINISSKLNLPVSGHHNFAFVDIDEIADTPLYLDPYVIQALSSEFCVKAQNSIESFFQELFLACQQQNKTRIKELLRYASEPNETNLGMKVRSHYGKGATADELTPLFLEFYRLVRKNRHVAKNPLALCMYIKNFDKDKMSDLITNIIRNFLHAFTIEQCKLWKISLTAEKVFVGYYWDSISLSWRELHDNTLEIENRKYLLVPKDIVRSRYVFNVECYIKQYVLKSLQNQHLISNSDMCTVKEYTNGKKVVRPPLRKELYKKEVHNTVHKEYALQATTKNNTHEINFQKDMFLRIRNGYGALTDKQLDSIVYKKHEISA